MTDHAPLTTLPVTDEPPVRRWPDARRVGLFVALALGLGALSGVGWWAVTDLPAFRVQAGGGAVTSERGLAGYIGADAWFVVCGVVVGLLVGVLGWRWFGREGWLVVVLVAVLGAAAAALCWTVGYRIEPGSFAVRLAAAQPGDVVPIDLTVRARAALAVWPLFAVIPVLLGSSLGRDPEVDDLDSVGESVTDGRNLRPGERDQVRR